MATHKFSYIHTIIILIIGFGFSFQIKADHVAAHPPPIRCYAIADGGNALLWTERLPLAPPVHTGNFVGGLGVSNPETMTFNLDGTIIYTVNDVSATVDTFGSVNPFTGAFTTIGSYTTANNTVLGVNTMDDVDSLAIHPLTGDMWAITHASPSYIFRIDIATGAIVPDTFGPGNDYSIVSLAGITGGPDEVDDLAIDPIDGTFYIIANNNTPDRLVIVNIDGFDPANSPGLNPATGQISTTDVSDLINSDGSGNVTDMEGYSFFNDGTFYGTTGDQSVPTTNNDSIWIIDKATGVTTLLGTMDDPSDATIHSDYEGLGCLTGGSNTLEGIAFCELYATNDGVYNAGDTLQAGATINLYKDTNNSGSVDGGDILIQTAITDGSGGFSFEIGVAGSFIVEMDSAIIPVGSIKTTHPVSPADPVSEADFVNTGAFGSEYNNTDNDNDFGFTCDAAPTGTDLAITKTDSTDPVLVGANFDYILTVTNNGPLAATGVSVTDTLPAGVSYVSNTGGCAVAGSTLTCPIGNLAIGASTSFNVTVTALTVGTVSNSASVTGNEPDINLTNNQDVEPTTIIDTTVIVTNTPDGSFTGIDPEGTPSILVYFDPGFSKLGFLQKNEVGLVGEQIEWVFTVYNNGTATGINIVITDKIIPELRIDKVVLSVGTYIINGQTVTVTIPSLAPGQSVQFSIFTTVMVSDKTVNNSACLNADNLDEERCVTAPVIGELPVTGETPWWANHTLLLGTFILLVSAGYISIRKLRDY